MDLILQNLKSFAEQLLVIISRYKLMKFLLENCYDLNTPL